MARLISEDLRHPCGAAVECVIADTCIGGVAEAARAAEKFAREGVGVSLTVSPCWCYGSETMDMDPLVPKAVWGFNGTERPGAVYLAAVLAGHNQKGLPAFGIYGRDVQDAGDTQIPDDVREKLLRFARAGLAVAAMRGKSYLSLGNISMGIAGSAVNADLFERYLGMRVETVDMVEFVRRIEREIFDPDEFARALAWVKTHCREGKDYNSKENQFTADQKEKVWQYSIKMAMIARDLMVGNPRLAELGFGEEALGHNALAAGFQGQRQWTDHLPNGDFMEAILNSSFDWNGIRQPYVMATENDSLNGLAMLFGHLLDRHGPGLRRRADLLEPGSRQEGHRLRVDRPGGRRPDPPDQLGRRGPGRRRPGKRRRPAGDEAFLADHPRRGGCLPGGHHLARRPVTEYFRGGGFSSQFVSHGRHAGDYVAAEPGPRAGPGAADCGGLDLRSAVARSTTAIDQRTNPTWPTTWFAPRLTGQDAFADGYTVMNAWGANHGAFSYGHVGADLITLASMLRIPVFMHNVPSQQVFRPSVWNAFGTAGLEGADFRACGNFGPLYG